MDALMICAALSSLVLLGALAWRRWRRRSDMRLQWQGTRERDWTIDELAALSATEAA
ncbi:MAG TPA: hypothetical protein VK507_20780 [Iamia sp.]|nr:hypothetical protein [Iamia sp.]